MLLFLIPDEVRRALMFPTFLSCNLSDAYFTEYPPSTIRFCPVM
jgi:hypothetical protein